jgi:hypothetical protein
MSDGVSRKNHTNAVEVERAYRNGFETVLQSFVSNVQVQPVPQEAIDAIRTKMKKLSVSGAQQTPTQEQVLDLLKRHRLYRYREYAGWIARQLQLQNGCAATADSEAKESKENAN